MHKPVSHLLSRLLNSGAAFDAPTHRNGTDRQAAASQTVQAAASQTVQAAGWPPPGAPHDEAPSDDGKRRDDGR
ncbi:hypothetical protein ACB268_17700 [Aeromonas sanarellii]